MKLSKEFEEKFKGVMKFDNAVQVCEAIRGWLEEKERQGEFRPFNARVNCTKQLEHAINHLEVELHRLSLAKEHIDDNSIEQKIKETENAVSILREYS